MCVHLSCHSCSSVAKVHGKHKSYNMYEISTNHSLILVKIYQLVYFKWETVTLNLMLNHMPSIMHLGRLQIRNNHPLSATTIYPWLHCLVPITNTAGTIITILNPLHHSNFCLPSYHNIIIHKMELPSTPLLHAAYCQTPFLDTGTPCILLVINLTFLHNSSHWIP